MTLTCLLVTADQELKDAVHGPHVEDEPQLCDTHGDQAEQQDGAEHTVHERGGSCGKKARGSGQETWPIQHPHPGEGKKALGAVWEVRVAKPMARLMVLMLISRFPELSGLCACVCVSVCKTGQVVPLSLARQNGNSVRGYPQICSQRFPTEAALGSSCSVNEDAPTDLLGQPGA